MSSIEKKELVLIEPYCREARKTERLKKILDFSLQEYTTCTIGTAEEFTESANLDMLKNKRILFAISLGESGINLEYYGILKKIRLDQSCMEGSVAGIIVDGNSELYTKSVARGLTLCANMAGCTFVGKPLVEGTKSLDNFATMAKILNVDNLEAYLEAGKKLVHQIMAFQPIRKKTPNILVLHASSHETSNTIGLWNLVKKQVAPSCKITEISLRNGTVMDCIGCPYKMCLHFGEGNSCYYGGVIVEQVYPAILACDALVLLCPNYNDAISANLSAFVNRLTALFRKTGFYEKHVFSIIVSGYSGSDIVAEQLIAGLNMNKSFVLPSHFAMMETANNPGSIFQCENIEARAEAFGKNILAHIWDGGIERILENPLFPGV